MSKVKKIIEYNKLVRDNVPEIINRQPFAAATWDRKTGNEKRMLLLSSLAEESAELNLAATNCIVDGVDEVNSEKLLGELADVIEMCYAIGEEFGFDLETIRKAVNVKGDERGLYYNGTYLKYVVENMEDKDHE